MKNKQISKNKPKKMNENENRIIHIHIIQKIKTHHKTEERLRFG